MKYSERRDSSPSLQQSPPQLLSLQCTRKSQFSKPGQPALGLGLHWILPFSTESSAAGVKHYPTAVLAVGGVCCSPRDGANPGSRGTFSSRQAQNKEPLQGAAQNAEGFVSPPLANLTKAQLISLSAPGIMARHAHSASSSPSPHAPISSSLCPHPHPSRAMSRTSRL